MPRIKGQDRRQRGGPVELSPRLDWLRQALADFESTYHAAMDAESWGAAVQAKTKAVQVRADVLVAEQCLQAAGLGVVADDAQQAHLTVEVGDVARHVGRATSLVLHRIDLDHRHRRFR